MSITQAFALGEVVSNTSAAEEQQKCKVLISEDLLIKVKQKFESIYKLRKVHDKKAAEH